MALEIAPEKVAHVIIKAREFDAKVGAWDSSPDDGDAEEDPASVLESFADDTVFQEAASFIEALNDDEQVSLVALAWIGRGTYEADELEEAIQTARDEAVNKTSDYLLGMPMLSDYLEEGLEATGSGNIVTSVILDYRAFDTLGEATVLFASIIGALAILRGRARGKARDKTGEEKQPSERGD